MEAEYTYDSLKRLIRIEDNHGVTEYTYDANGNRTKSQWTPKDKPGEDWMTIAIRQASLITKLNQQNAELRAHIQSISDWVLDLMVEIEAAPGSAVTNVDAWNNYIAKALWQIADNGRKKLQPKD
jgi:YD repeat-containing protein